MPRYEFRDDKGFKYVTFTQNYEIALRNAKINGFTEDQLVEEAPDVLHPADPEVR